MKVIIVYPKYTHILPLCDFSFPNVFNKEKWKLLVYCKAATSEVFRRSSSFRS